MKNVLDLYDEVEQLRRDFTHLIKMELYEPVRDEQTLLALRGYRDRVVFTLRLIETLAGNPRQTDLFD